MKSLKDIKKARFYNVLEAELQSYWEASIRLAMAANSISYLLIKNSILAQELIKLELISLIFKKEEPRTNLAGLQE